MNIIGKKFNEWTVLENSTNKKRYFICRCKCGKVKEVRIDKLIKGESKSCGCLRNHKLTNTRIYHIWENIKSRCYNKNNPRNKNYGARGISVCDEWKNDFKTFYHWAISNGYADNLTIDRIDNNGNYEPNNCRWVDKITQANNTSRNRYLTYNDKKLTISQWSRELNINKATLLYWINSRKYTINDIINNTTAPKG